MSHKNQELLEQAFMDRFGKVPEGRVELDPDGPDAENLRELVLTDGWKPFGKNSYTIENDIWSVFVSFEHNMYIGMIHHLKDRVVGAIPPDIAQGLWRRITVGVN